MSIIARARVRRGLSYKAGFRLSPIPLLIIVPLVAFAVSPYRLGLTYTMAFSDSRVDARLHEYYGQQFSELGIQRVDAPFTGFAHTATVRYVQQGIEHEATIRYGKPTELPGAWLDAGASGLAFRSEHNSDVRGNYSELDYHFERGVALAEAAIRAVEQSEENRLRWER